MTDKLLRAHNNKGFTLLEVIFVSGVGIVLLTALLQVNTFALKNSVFAKNQARATKLAREEMELVRAFRDRHGLTPLVCAAGTQCHISNVTSASGITAGKKTVGEFSQYFEIRTDPAGNCTAPSKYIVGITEWMQGQGANPRHTAELTTCLTDWRTISP